MFDGAQLFSLVEFGRKDRENNQSAPSLGKAFGKESIIKISDSWILCAVTLSAEWITKGTTVIVEIQLLNKSRELKGDIIAAPRGFETIDGVYE